MTYRTRLVAQSIDRLVGWLVAVLDRITMDVLRTRRARPTMNSDKRTTHAKPRRVPADRSPKVGGIGTRAISMNTGHHRLADGSVIRVDYECLNTNQ